MASCEGSGRWWGRLWLPNHRHTFTQPSTSSSSSSSSSSPSSPSSLFLLLPNGLSNYYNDKKSSLSFLPTPTLPHIGRHWLTLWNTIVFGFCCSDIVWRFGVRARGPWNLCSCVNVGQDLFEVLICAQRNAVWGRITPPLSLLLDFPKMLLPVEI